MDGTSAEAGTPRARAVSVREAARIVGIGGTLMYELIREGEGPPVITMGKRRKVIRVAALEQWLEDRETKLSGGADGDVRR